MTRTDALPELLARIAEAAGIDVARKLSAEFGGTIVYIPEKPIANNALVRSIGAEATNKIIAHIGHGLVGMPMAPQWHRREAIAALLDRGESLHAIALKLHVHVRTVARHKRALKSRS